MPVMKNRTVEIRMMAVLCGGTNPGTLRLQDRRNPQQAMMTSAHDDRGDDLFFGDGRPVPR
jgi:hypothetical protein